MSWDSVWCLTPKLRSSEGWGEEQGLAHNCSTERQAVVPGDTLRTEADWEMRKERVSRGNLGHGEQ